MSNIAQEMILDMLQTDRDGPHNDMSTQDYLCDFFGVSQLEISDDGNVWLDGDECRWVGSAEILEFLQWAESICY